MADFAIHVEGLGKRYKIGKVQTGYKTMREAVVEAVQAPFQRIGTLFHRTAGHAPTQEEAIWALKDVSFDVKRGEVVGIIGRNGAGKSSLLKILSRITEPTEGRGGIYGRVGSLLEVGTGFHPELTGRENIYLNGAVLGMKKAEIKSKFDEIVAFAEVERFIDTPVKHYSSGMYLRLAFAVAAHLESDILLVDEVLAVGDARFQKRCLNKMQDVGNQGRTVLYVSHNMPAIARLCKRAILLDGGKLAADGLSHKVVSLYLNSGLGTTASRIWTDSTKPPGGEVARLRAVHVRTEEGSISDALDIRRPIGLEMEYEVIKPGYILLPRYFVSNEEGVEIFTVVDLDPMWRCRPRPAGKYVTTAWIPGNLLTEGTHFVSMSLNTLEPKILQFHERDVVAFQVIDSLDGNSARGDWAGVWPGIVRPLLKWQTQFTPQATNVWTEQRA